MDETGLKPAADVVGEKMLETPSQTEQLVPTKSEIHTVETGSLAGHERAPTCWCKPVQHPEDERIWIHGTLEEILSVMKTTGSPGEYLALATAAAIGLPPPT